MRIIEFLMMEVYILREYGSIKIPKKDDTLGPNQSPILNLDKFFGNLYNHVLQNPRGSRGLRFIFRGMRID